VRSSEPGRRILIGYAAASAVLALVATFGMPSEGMAPTPTTFRWLGLASTMAAGSFVWLNGVWSAAGAYAVVFWCFHFGLVAALGSGLVRSVDLSLWDQAWLLGPFGADAAALALAGSLACAAGACAIRARRPPAPRAEAPAAHSGAAHPHGAAGSILVFGAAAFWCAVVLATGGTSGFFVSYAEYLRMTDGFSTPMAVAWLVLACGIVLSVTGTRGPLRTAAVAGFACLALVAVPLGLRGEILFPTLAALVALARCGRPLPPLAAGAFLTALLLLIPIAREVRTTGLRGLPGAVLQVPRLDALVEMGGSLHPVEKVVRWRAEGEPLDGGRSYWAPIERAAARLLPELQSRAAADDPRIMNVLVLDRVGAIGFSPVAEAFRNFGPVGVVIVMGLLGMGLGAIDSIRDTRLAVLVVAAVYVPLLINIRNSFVSVPAHCAAGILIVAGLGALRHVLGSVVCRPYARAAYLRSEI
jgi:hypothetical protein